MNSTANLLASHNFLSEAEEAYRLAKQIVPGNSEALNGLASRLCPGGKL